MDSTIISKRNLPQNIEGDELSLEISSYPIFVKYLASRIGHKKTLLELCTGIGISLMYLSSSFDVLYGVEIDSKILAIAKQNIDKSNLTHKVTLILDDVRNIDNFVKYKPQVVIYDIPYWSDHGSDLLKRNPDLKSLLIDIKSKLTTDIVIYSPNKYDFEYYSKLFDERIQIEEIYINGKHDRNVVYFGNLVKKVGTTRIDLS